MEKKLGTSEMVLEEGRRRKWRFSKATRKAKSETLKFSCSREWKLFSHDKHQIKDHNSQIVEICPMNLQTEFREDPTIN